VREDASDPMVGTTVGERYVLLDRIGQGGSGTIYKAEHVTLRRKVAVKVLHHELSRDDLAIERFRREATTVGQIENDHIVEIFDFGRTGDGRLYLAMELLEGETLADLIERGGQLEVERAVDILIQLSETLMEAHAMGYIHRDLRPRNVFLAQRRGKGRREFVKLLDFGLAKLVEKEGEAASTSLGMTFGDPHYMSPEQARGDALDRRADIYSLGCIAYEMLVGEPPFVGGKVFDILTRHVEATPVAPQARRTDVPTWLDRAVVRMLAKRSDQRFITVFRVIEALRQGSDSGHIMADEIARRAESIPPTSVSQAIAKLGARGPSDMETDTSPTHSMEEGTAAVMPPRLAEPAAAPKNGSEPRIGGVTALGLGVGPGGKRAQLAQSAARAAQPPPEPTAEPAPPPAPTSAGNGQRASNGSGGLSAAWYADGDAMADEGLARIPRRAARLSPGDTGLVIQDDDDIPPRRRSWRLAAILGGAIIIGAGGVFAIVAARSGDDDSGAGAEVAAEEPKPPGELVAAAPAQPVEPSPAAAPATADAGAVAAAVVAEKTEKAEAEPAPADEPARPEADQASPAPRKKTSATRPPRDREPRKADDAEAERPRPQPRGDVDAGKADFYAKLGDRDLANGDFLGAATNYNKARELDPNNAAAILGLGEIALSQGATDAAVSHLRRAAKLRPRSARAHTLLGEALLAAGRRDQAAASFKRALRIAPGDDRAQNGLGEAAGDSEPPPDSPRDEPEETELQ
jgi:tRNA A-37 threonylcarbamoyl transferase component Bud32